MVSVHARSAVKRRAAGINQYSGEGAAGDQSALRRSSQRAVQRILDYTNKHYATDQNDDAKILRRRMVQAGIYDQHAVAYFFIGRTGLALALAFAASIFLPSILVGAAVFWLGVMGRNHRLFGARRLYQPTYFARRLEHQMGFRIS
jgi:tight adherence protein C